MTEDQIERRAERQMNVLDRAFMRGDIDQKTYDHEVMILDKWAAQQYRAHTTLECDY